MEAVARIPLTAFIAHVLHSGVASIAGIDSTQPKRQKRHQRKLPSLKNQSQQPRTTSILGTLSHQREPTQGQRIQVSRRLIPVIPIGLRIVSATVNSVRMVVDVPELDIPIHVVACQALKELCAR